MAMVDLRFGNPLGAVSPQNLALRFVTAPAQSAALHLQSAAPRLHLVLQRPQYSGALHLQSAAPALQIAGSYDSRVSRPLTATAQPGWQQGNARRRDMHTGWQQSDILKRRNQTGWQQGAAAQSATPLRMQQSGPLANANSARWQQGAALDMQRLEAWQQRVPQHRRQAGRWQQGEPLARTQGDDWRQLLPINRPKSSTWQQGRALRRAVRDAMQQAVRLHDALQPRWQQGMRPKPGRWVPVVEIDAHPPYRGTTDLRFGELLTGSTDLRFVKQEQPRSGRTVFIVNEISFTRLFDGREIQLLSCSVGIDIDSWCWSFTGSIPFDQIELLDPALVGNTEVELVINGLRWRFMIEGFSKSETFGQTTANLRGRSLTARLDDPYAPLRTHTEPASKTAVQLAQQELDRAGTGYALDWGLVDALGWMVPGGGWSYQNLSPAQAIKRLAVDAGGVVQSHPWEKRLIVRPEYSLPPWQWTTADLTIDPNLIRQRGTEWQEKPAYNGVLVSGTRFGVSALVKVTGTDGAFQPQAVVASVLTEGAANRQRGLTELSRYGPQRRRTLEMPLHPDLGLVLPGLLVGVGGQIGMVRSVGIGVQGGGKVSQTMEVEEHVG